MKKTDYFDVARAVEFIELNLGPEWEWEISKITNPHHMVRPYGAGLAVTLFGPGEKRVREKDVTASAAAVRAVIRAKRVCRPDEGGDDA